MERLFFALTFFAALGSGLMAGLFFAFSAFGMTALGRLPPPNGIAAMQAINVEILNPLFFLVFFGTAAACIVLAIAAMIGWSEPGAAVLLVGSVLYLVGNILVTIVFNVPLNNELAAVDPDGVKGATVWTRYLSVWTAWNHVRTVACLAATASLIMALR
ncbi:MAG: DUF1772 domain-containing protein [Rhizobiales bacterium]|nr:DUF1772 domain-containing protein [Hyphomicrobiales bacterium]